MTFHCVVYWHNFSRSQPPLPAQYPLLLLPTPIPYQNSLGTCIKLNSSSHFAIKMPTSIAAFVHHLSDYEHDYVVAAENDECLMCRTSYSLPGHTGCRAIRLKSCGHIIGHECFNMWIKNHAGTCPYWNHALPTRPDRIFSFAALLSQICLTGWFEWIESWVYLFHLSDDGVDQHFQVALNAIYSDRLTLAHAGNLLFSYTAPALLCSFFTGAIVWLGVASLWTIGVCLGVVGSTVIACLLFRKDAGNEMYLPSFQPLDYPAVAIAYLALLNVALFTLVVLGLLTIGLWRSYTRKFTEAQAAKGPPKEN